MAQGVKGTGKRASEPRPNLPCSECGEPTVRPRRPSETGKHFCKKPACQAAKQRFYQKRSRSNVKLSAEQERVRFVRAACGERIHCTACGLTTAVVGFPHRDQYGKLCLAMGRGGSGVLSPEWLDAAMPPSECEWSL